MDNKINNNYRVGIYLRLSNEDRDKIDFNDSSESIKNQRNMLIDYINNHSNLILVDEYCDEDLSGAGTYRPEFERLIRDCENKKLDIVLCKSQSRFSRDMEIVERYINNKFKEWNIRFIGLADNADTLVLGNKKSRQINGLVNEWYLEDVSNNIRSAFKSKMKQGEFISPFAPYGYEISLSNNNKLVIDPIASLVVKDIYNLYLSGLGFMGIAKYLNAKNIPSPSLYKYQKGIKLNVVSNKPRDEIKWNTNAVKTILTNEVYLGNLIQGKRTTVSYKNHKIIKKNKCDWIRKENTHDGIIDEYLFNKVQMAIKERCKPVKSVGIVHIFSGKVFCFECGSYMRKKNSIKYEYLVCSNNCSNKTSIRYDKLENLILDSINKKIEIYYDIKELNNLFSIENNIIFKEKIKFLEKEKNNISKNISKKNNYLKCLYEDKVNDIISLEQFNNLINIYNKEINSYKKQIGFINEKIFDYKSKDNYFNNKSDIFNRYKKIDKLNRVIIEEFIDKIHIGKIDKLNKCRDIHIKWNM